MWNMRAKKTLQASPIIAQVIVQLIFEIALKPFKNNHFMHVIPCPKSYNNACLLTRS